MVRTMFACSFPWPPSLNHATRHTRGGGHYKTIEAKRFRHAAKLIAHTERRRIQWPTTKARVAVRVDLYPPNRHAFDVDGKLKEILDALQDAGVFVNDRQVRDLRVVAHDDATEPNGRCMVRVALHSWDECQNAKPNAPPIDAPLQLFMATL
jgi:crossover junction endodeoxyribonuclease RusA